MAIFTDEGGHHSSALESSAHNKSSATSSAQEKQPELGILSKKNPYPLSPSNTLYTYFLGYHDTELNFGIIKKDKASGIAKYRPASDFEFDILAEVICSNPNSSGFMIKLTPDRDTASSPPPSRLFACTHACTTPYL